MQILTSLAIYIPKSYIVLKNPGDTLIFNQNMFFIPKLLHTFHNNKNKTQ